MFTNFDSPEKLGDDSFDAFRWRGGTPLDLGLWARTYSLCSEYGIKKIRSRVVGYRAADFARVRPKSDCIMLMLRNSNDEWFWFHVSRLEFLIIFPEFSV